MKHKIHQPSNSLELFKYVKGHGESRDSSRGMTKEIIGAGLRIRNPRNRLDTTRSRKMNPAFAFAEFIAMLSGIERVSFFEQFIPAYGEYSSNGLSLDGAYGTRVVASNGNQIEAVIEKLRRKPQSRRAVVSIYDREDLISGAGGLNTPCTLALQFIQGHHGQLDMVAYMRSSDIYLGLPNDIVAFTMLQEYVATQLGWPLGEYTHIAGSLHYYEDDKLEDKMLQAREEGRWPRVMLPMTEYLDISNLTIAYNNINSEDAIEAASATLDDFSRDVILVGASIARRKTNPEMAGTLYNAITCSTLRRVTLPWIREVK